MDPTPREIPIPVKVPVANGSGEIGEGAGTAEGVGTAVGIPGAGGGWLDTTELVDPPPSTSTCPNGKDTFTTVPFPYG
jgi:hypothetical protein